MSQEVIISDPLISFLLFFPAPNVDAPLEILNQNIDPFVFLDEYSRFKEGF